MHRKVIDIIYVLFVAPLLWSLATNKFPENYKYLIVWLAIIIGLFHLYRLLCTDSEYMTNVTKTTQENPNVHYVKIFDSYPGYDQPHLYIKKGDTVVWINIGEIEHSVTSDSGNFNSGLIKPGEHFAVKFDFTGQYPYHCVDHVGWMIGYVIVQ
jgi:plastocyanin